MREERMVNETVNHIDVRVSDMPPLAKGSRNIRTSSCLEDESTLHWSQYLSCILSPELAGSFDKKYTPECLCANCTVKIKEFIRSKGIPGMIDGKLTADGGCDSDILAPSWSVSSPLVDTILVNELAEQFTTALCLIGSLKGVPRSPLWRYYAVYSF